MSPSPAAPLRTVLVGAGGIADAVHMPSIREIGDELIVVDTVVEIDDDRRTAFAEKWGVPHRTSSLDDALARHPDLVILCTPPSLHRDQVMACLDAGVTVWCEKPPALSLADYDAMTAGERDGGPWAPIVFQQRYGSGAEHARTLLTSGALGRPLIAHCQTTWFRDEDYFAAPWRGSFSGDGGPIMALGIHQIDLLLTLLGDWEQISAQIARRSRDIETDDVATAWVRFADGTLVTIANSAVSPAQESHLRIDAEKATVELTHLYGYDNDDWRYTPAPGVPETEAATWRNGLPNERSTHTPQLRTLVADVLAGRRPQASGDDGRKALELVTALYKSALTGQIIRRGSIGDGDPFYAALNGGISF
ncbi:putative dehydrogenase [Microbacterium natoriense]|uniref:Dehydrogenase n=1 Tax=Microbacterium natoriense TaxID=284570 RepID=A0AAW8ETS5_9MICO|nr:Gfo/Idh/MocA family oxidoreductase [Microbacterium natoriense]MDQ0646527.1 putative dehydrogenase [Microbacterium natoriense]